MNVCMLWYCEQLNVCLLWKDRTGLTVRSRQRSNAVHIDTATVMNILTGLKGPQAPMRKTGEIQAEGRVNIQGNLSAMHYTSWANST